MIRRLAASVALLPLAAAALAQPADSTRAPRLWLVAEGHALVPVGDLATRFAPTVSGAVGVGVPLSRRGTLDLTVTGASFARRDDVAMIEDSSRAFPGLDLAALETTLGFVGATAAYRHAFGAEGARLRPFVSMGGGFVRWTERRGVYRGQLPGGVTDSVPAVRRQQASGLAQLGGGVDVALTPRLTASLGARVSMIPATLDGALRLRLAEVRTMPWASAVVGVRARL